jgi:hypothetical protein
VTVDPINGILFSMDMYEGKPSAFISIKNMSDKPIIFKSKVTMPNNYQVKPN